MHQGIRAENEKTQKCSALLSNCPSNEEEELKKEEMRLHRSWPRPLMSCRPVREFSGRYVGGTLKLV